MCGKVKKLLYEAARNKYLLLIAVYFFAHFMLCLISGQWWDDWCYWINGAEHLKIAYLESGIPLQAYNIISVMWLPNWGYRIVVFFLFLAIGLMFYSILRRLDFMTDEDAFWISAISMVVPVNDARTILNCYGYSISLFIFFLAFYALSKLNKLSEKKAICIRIISLISLLYSYTTESLLVFTGLIWLYLFYVNWIESTKTKSISKVLGYFRSYWDFLVLPFAYFIIKGIYFKPYGAYTGYNSITIKSFIDNLQISPLAALNTLINLGRLYREQIRIYSSAVFAVITIMYMILSIKKNSPKHETIQIKKQLKVFFLGVIVYYTGIFSYIIIRGRELRVSGVESRDSMLAGFGIAIMIVAFARCIPVKKTIQNIIPLFFVVFGIFTFNNSYLNYQEDWYHQQEFANAISQYNGFDNANTILCNFTNKSPVGGTRFYSLNGMSYEIIGKMDKFYFSNISELSYGLDFNNHLLSGYNADDYDYSDTTIDAILSINNAPISNRKLLKLRFDELFQPIVFEEEIQNLTDIKYIIIDKESSDHIYDLYKNHSLTSDTLQVEIDSHECVSEN